MMVVKATEGPRAHLYKVVLKELAQNGALDARESRWQNDKYKDDKGNNALTTVLSHLATPTSHRLRVEMGLTVQDEDGVAHGAVVRVGQSQYVWDRDMVVIDRRTLVTEDPVVRRYNAQWTFHEEPKVEPEPVMPTFEMNPGRMPTLKVTPELAAAAFTVIAYDGERVVLQNGTKVVVAKVESVVGQ